MSREIGGKSGEDSRFGKEGSTIEARRTQRKANSEEIKGSRGFHGSRNDPVEPGEKIKNPTQAKNACVGHPAKVTIIPD